MDDSHVGFCLEHQGVVEVAQTMDLGLGSLRPHLELILDNLERQ